MALPSQVPTAAAGTLMAAGLPACLGAASGFFCAARGRTAIVSNATATPVNASISTPVCAMVRATHFTSSPDSEVAISIPTWLRFRLWQSGISCDVCFAA